MAEAIGAALGQPEQILVAAQSRPVVVETGRVPRAGLDVLGVEQHGAYLPTAGVPARNGRRFGNAS